MTTILLSIHPRHAINIMMGNKRWEFRRNLPFLNLKDPLSTIIFYATKPWGQVVCQANVELHLCYPFDELQALWYAVENENPGITEEEFYRYFKGCKQAYAVKLCNVVVLYQPEFPHYGLRLSDFGVKCAPQNFCYLPEKVNKEVNSNAKCCL